MVSRRDDDITMLLHAAAHGDEDASSRVYSLLYDELHQLARRQLFRQGRQSLEDLEAEIRDWLRHHTLPH